MSWTEIADAIKYPKMNKAILYGRVPGNLSAMKKKKENSL